MVSISQNSTFCQTEKSKKWGSSYAIPIDLFLVAKILQGIEEDEYKFCIIW